MKVSMTCGSLNPENEKWSPVGVAKREVEYVNSVAG